MRQVNGWQLVMAIDEVRARAQDERRGGEEEEEKCPGRCAGLARQDGERRRYVVEVEAARGGRDGRREKTQAPLVSEMRRLLEFGGREDPAAAAAAAAAAAGERSRRTWAERSECARGPRGKRRARGGVEAADSTGEEVEASESCLLSCCC